MVSTWAYSVMRINVVKVISACNQEDRCEKQIWHGSRRIVKLFLICERFVKNMHDLWKCERFMKNMRDPKELFAVHGYERSGRKHVSSSICEQSPEFLHPLSCFNFSIFFKWYFLKKTSNINEKCQLI
ncbi:hypothetical protein BKP45_15020 [Anaerobacillus alkalidiazotrophicus]|uniref:Uncharacterized protein n=1 Tax=Anaerobacillus alkalidiazotrophicus TaxID=472963 RepID=A0A1S2M2T8_9BACI|nr:hypothetical protein BKP45_15020 [Anaerobacillus alkalidiazotrophicus]